MSSRSKEKVLGVDPGLATTGWGVIEKNERKIKSESKDWEFIECGCILTSSKDAIQERLTQIYKEIRRTIIKHNPYLIVIEEVFFGKNTKTAILIGEAIGVIILGAQALKKNIRIVTPLQVKTAICGYGRAEKIQIQKMVQRLLKLESIPRPDDAADALAVAMTGAILEKVGKGKSSFSEGD